MKRFRILNTEKFPGLWVGAIALLTAKTAKTLIGQGQVEEVTEEFEPHYVEPGVTVPAKD